MNARIHKTGKALPSHRKQAPQKPLLFIYSANHGIMALYFITFYKEQRIPFYNVEWLRRKTEQTPYMIKVKLTLGLINTYCHNDGLCRF